MSYTQIKDDPTEETPKYETIPWEDFTQDQKDAVRAVMDWIGDPNERQVMTLGGLAGTGKTTISKEIMNRLREQAIHTATTAFTGKAVYVMQRKGLREAQTLHSLAYRLVDKTANNKPIFERVKALAPQIKLVLNDESSMINKEQDEDLRKLAPRILYIGDHGQLEPIGDNPGLMLNPDIKLEQIHRGAENDEIIQFAMELRKGKRYWPEYRKDGRLEIGPENLFWDKVASATVGIVGYNKTRHIANRHVRKEKGHTYYLPRRGEKIICLRNQRDYGVYNGLVVEITSIGRETGNKIYYDFKDDAGNTWKNIPTLCDQYGSTGDFESTSACRFDFGHVLTGHKVQGSEYENVVVFEQIASSWDPRRWGYTAATRSYGSLGYYRRN